jgi:signal transduction histidine kinase
MTLPFLSSNRSRLAIRPRFLLAMLVALLVGFGVLIVMAGLLPPGAVRSVRIDAVAAALRGSSDDMLTRTVAVAPPASGDHWLEAPGARRQLAAILRVPVADVRLVVAAPVQVRPVAPQSALAGQPPIRAAFLPFAQDGGTAVPAAAPPVTVVVPPPAAPTPTPAPKSATPKAVTPKPAAAPAARETPRVARPATTETPRPAQRAPATSQPPQPMRVETPVRPAPEPVVAAPPVVENVQAPEPVTPPAPAPVAAPPTPRVPEAVQEIAGPFRAALRLPGGGWAVVQPLPEPFPNTTQQRMILWFLVALAVTLPIAWGLAILLARPLLRFAAAAERSGREPGGATPLTGVPAELVPALTAIEQLQMRTQSLSGDRSAFAGTLRNELQAPLERLRAGLNDAPRQIREAFHDDLTDIEEAVAALQLFLSDAAAPKLVGRHDLGELMRRSAAAASETGDPVVADAATAAWVQVDPDAIGRLFEHLIAYARRRGGHVTMRLTVEGDSATVDMTDSGRPEPTGFAPGLHGKAERAGSTRPSGPGLAVARSIARTHGGEVLLVRSDDGMAAKLRLPIAKRG